MNQTRTGSILQRYAVVLAVTAASYGLPQAQAQGARIGAQHSAPQTQPAQQR